MKKLIPTPDNFAIGCDRIALFCLYGIAWFFPISKAIIESLSILAIVCFLLKAIASRQFKVFRGSLANALFAYLLVCLVSIFYSTNINISARTFTCKILQDVLFFFAVADTLNKEHRIKIFLFTFLASASLLSIDGIYQQFTHRDFIRNRPYYWIPRIHATFATPNDFGCYLTSVLPFAVISFFIHPLNKKIRIWSLLLFIALSACLILTVSRGAWFAFLSSILFMSIWIGQLLIVTGFFGIVILTTHCFFYPELKERLSNLLVFHDNSASDRLAIWRAAINMFLQRPWIGLGLGTFMFNFRSFSDSTYLYDPPYAHNCYLQIATELGITGLVSFLAILSIFFLKGIKLLNYGEKSIFWYMLLACLAAVLGYSVQMFVDTNFYSLDLGILFWLVLGIGQAAMAKTELKPLKA